MNAPAHVTGSGPTCLLPSTSQLCCPPSRLRINQGVLVTRGPPSASHPAETAPVYQEAPLESFQYHWLGQAK